MHLFLLFVLLLGSAFGTPLTEYERELEKSGLDVEKIHELIKAESREVEEEFGTKEKQEELSKLRADYAALHPSNETVRHVQTELEINGELASELFEGDIMLTPEQWKVALDRHPTEPLTRRQALSCVLQLWKPMTAAVIPFTFEPGFPEASKSVIYESHQFWMQRTCVTFRAATAADTDLISYNHNAAGCSSHVGRIGGKQLINLGPGCMSVAVVTHEISHALGTLHVQSRSDRDNYVTIDTSNIQTGMEHNFLKDPTGYGTLFNYGIPYEFGSVQHYSEFAFAKNASKPTIYAKPSYAQYQNSMEGPRATYFDTMLMNRMYQCYSKCSVTPLPCANYGTTNHDCTKCLCPRGYSGFLCENQDPSAIRVNYANSGTYSLRVEIGDGTNSGFREKTYIIEAPLYKRMNVSVTRVGEFWWSMCRSIGMELFNHYDTRYAGFRYCSSPKVSFQTSNNRLTAWLYVDNAYKFFADISIIVF